MPAGRHQSGGRGGSSERRARQTSASRLGRILRGLLTITEFGIRHDLPKRAIEGWIRNGRLHTGNGLVVVRGRTYIDPKLFQSFFS